jgi:hypothetical protein
MITEGCNTPLIEIFNVCVKVESVEANKRALETGPFSTDYFLFGLISYNIISEFCILLIRFAGRLNLTQLNDPKAIASLLISFFVELPEPLIQSNLLDQFLESQCTF